MDDGTEVETLKAEKERLNKRIKSYAVMKADGELTADEYRDRKSVV